MATCPNCGTANKPGASFCANCRKPLPKKFKRLGTQQLGERVPDWLNLLLAKYREVGGPLVGFEAETPLPPDQTFASPDIIPEPGTEEAELSALLDQMAEEGPSQLSDDRLSSSVEWGAYGDATDEPPPPPVDNLLSDMAGIQPDQPTPTYQESGEIEIPDWLSGPSDTSIAQESGQDYAQTGEPGAETDYDLPDWLTGPTPPSDESDERFVSSEEEIPDWITDAPASAQPPIAPAVPSPEEDLPDWLSDDLPPLPDSASEPPTTSTATDEDVAVPDWLQDALDKPVQTAPLKPQPEEASPPPEPAGQEPTMLSAGADSLVEPEPPPVTDSPDWPDELPPIGIEASEADGAELGKEAVPGWLSEMPTPTADVPEAQTPPETPPAGEESADWSVPDWIALEMTDQEEEELGAAEATDSQEIPDWMIEDEPATTAKTPAADEPTPAETESAEVPDWLMALGDAATEEGEASGPTETASTEPDDWLDSFDLPPAEEETEDDIETMPPVDMGWLRDLDLPAAEGTEDTETETGTADEADWLQTLDAPPFEEPSDVVTEEEAPLPKSPPIEGVEAAWQTEPTTTVQAEAPPWPAEDEDIRSVGPMREASDKEKPTDKPVSKLKRLKPLKRDSEKPTGPALPDWVAGLVPPNQSDKQLDEAKPEIPDWTADLVPPTTTSTGPAVSPTPEWAQTLIPPNFEITGQEPPQQLEKFTTPAEAPVEPLPEDSTQQPDGSDLPDDQAIAAIERPQSLETVEDAPPWLSDLPADDTSVAEPDYPAEEADETSDWIAQFSQPAVETEETDQETDWSSAETETLAGEDELVSQRLDWLMAPDESEPPTPPPVTEPSAAEEPPEQPILAEEPEIPDWLTATADTHTVEEIPAPTIAEETETPDWLAELGEVSIEKEAERLEEAGAVAPDEEIPAWLAELPEAPAEEAPPPIAAAEDSGTPDWLTELGDITAEEEIPDWLVEESEGPSGETLSAEAELETPDWLSEMPETPVEQAPEPPAEEAEVSEVSAEALSEPISDEAEPEIPDWLAEVSETPTDEPSPPPAAEAETPDWLAGLSELEPTEEETPASLAELPETFGEDFAAPPAAEEEVETPDWLTQLGEGPTEKPAATAEEQELPDWLSALRETPPAEAPEPPPAAAPAEPAATETEATPEWLDELPAAPAEETPAPLPTAAETPEALAETAEALPAVEEVPETASPEEELEIPDWLAELPEAPTDEETPAQLSTEEEAEMPDWLADVRESPTKEVAAAEEELEIPDWLSGSPEAPSVEEKTESPHGLPELPETPTEEALAEPLTTEVDETPEWLAELPGTPAEETSPSTMPEVESEASALEEMPVEPTLEKEAELPPWLVELPETAADETSIAPVETEAEIPEWLSDTPEAAPTQTTTDEDEPPEWLAGLVEPPVEAATPPAPQAELEAAAEEDLAEPSVEQEAELPPWLAELPETPVEAPEAPPLVEEVVTTAEEAEATPEAETLVEESEPDWLAELGVEEELVLPDWLSEPPEGVVKPESDQPVTKEAPDRPDQLTEAPAADAPAEAKMPSPADEADETLDRLGGTEAAEATVETRLTPEEADASEAIALEGEPEVPDWLADTLETPASEAPPPVEEKIEPDDEESPPGSSAPEDSTAPPQASLADAPFEPATDDDTLISGSGLQTLRPTGQEVTGEDRDIAESTGLLSGLSGMLPAQKMTAGAPVAELGPAPLEGQKDAIMAAAREFYTIATRTPQPATLPAPLTRRDHLVKGAGRAVLYLVFIALIALPLIPGLQKRDSSDPERKIPWTEPGGTLTEVLDRQRRELISNELGIIDLQQPDSVALVSVDYTPATQGELQPLAEAVLGRLRGQGMRLIFISLEPEGTSLAQHTLESILAERDEAYGEKMVNLGYLPGQVAAIRELAGGRKPFSMLTDYQSGTSFSNLQQNGWGDVENIGQVNVVVNITDNPATARWWVEQMEFAVEPDDDEQFLLAATSVTADPFLRPYRESGQLDGLISGINGAAAVEASRKNFGPARQMLDSQSVAHLLIVILIAVGTMAGWMPPAEESPRPTLKQSRPNKSSKTNKPD